MYPILTITLKNVLRTFEAEIHKIFKNIQPLPKDKTFLKKVYVDETQVWKQIFQAFVGIDIWLVI